MPKPSEPCDLTKERSPASKAHIENKMSCCFKTGDAQLVFDYVCENIPARSFDDIHEMCRAIRKQAKNPKKTETAISPTSTVQNMKINSIR